MPESAYLQYKGHDRWGGFQHIEKNIEITYIASKEDNTAVNLGQSIQLSAITSPSGTEAQVLWTSSDENVIKVDNFGVVTGVGLDEDYADITYISLSLYDCETQEIIEKGRCNIAVNPFALKFEKLSDNTARFVGFEAGSRPAGRFEIPSTVTIDGTECTVTEIGDYAFNNQYEPHYALQEVVIPNTVTTIGDFAFSNCDRLSVMYIPGSVTSIGKGAFAGSCSVEKFDVDKSNTAYCSIDGILYNKSQTTLVSYPCDSQNYFDYAIPQSVETIGAYAFAEAESIGKVVVPTSVKTIEEGAFYCSSISYLWMKSSTPPICGENAFKDFNHDAIYIPIGTRSLYEAAFGTLNFQEPNVTSLTIDYAEEEVSVGYSSSLSVTSAPENNIAPRDLVWQSSDSNVLQVDEYGSILAVGIGEATVTVSAGTVTASCTIKVNANTEGNLPTSIALNDAVVNLGTELHLNINSTPRDATIKYARWFSSDNSVAEVYGGKIYPKSVGSAEITVCVAGTDRILTATCTVEVMPEVLITYIPLLDSDEQETGKASVEKLYDTSYTGTITIPTRVSIGDKQYDVTEIGSRAFSGSKASAIIFSDSIKAIRSYAFQNCSNLTNVELPYGVTTIGDGAFHQCSNLNVVKLPRSLTSIGKSAFYACTNLQELWSLSLKPATTNQGAFEQVNTSSCILYVPVGRTSTYRSRSPWSAFNDIRDAYTLKPLNDSDVEVVASDEYAFIEGGINFDTVTDKNITAIAADAFSGCKGITSVSLPASIGTIGSKAFGGCTGIKEVRVHTAQVPACATDAFSDVDPDPVKLYVTPGLKGQYAETAPWSSFKTIIEMVDVESIALNTTTAELNIENTLELQVMPTPANALVENVVWSSSDNTVATVDENGIVTPKAKGTTTITATLAEDITASCEVQVVVTLLKYTRNDNDMTAAVFLNDLDYAGEVVIPAETEDGYAVTSIARFKGGKAITKVTIPNSVTSISDGAFQNCTSLVAVNIPEGVTAIPSSLFEGCKALKSISIPNSVTVPIGSSAFKDCTGLQEMWMWQGTVMGYGLDALKNVNKNTCTIYVPAHLRETYEKHDNWKAFKKFGSFSITMNTASVTRTAGETFQLATALDVTPDAQTEPQMASLIWASSDENVATVDENGTVTTINKGEATITATCGPLTATCAVLVNTAQPFTFTVDKSTMTACVAKKDGETYDEIDIPDVTYIDGERYGVTTIAANGFACLSDITSVTISDSITTIGSGAFSGCTGLTEIKSFKHMPPTCGTDAFAGIEYENCQLIVPQGAGEAYRQAAEWCNFSTSIVEASITLNYSTATINIGDTLRLAIIKDEATDEDFIGDIQWSSNSTRATVDSNGLVTAKAPGDVVITATSARGLKAVCELHITCNLIESNVLAESTVLAYTNTETCEGVDITYTRNFKTATLQALYVPFSMTYTDWCKDFDVYRINGFFEYDTNEDGKIDQSELELIKIKDGHGDLKPNYPYFIKAKTAGVKTITLNNATLYAAKINSIDCSTVETKYTFTGTYTPMQGLYSAGYRFTSNGALSTAADDNVTLGAFRWYMKAESRGTQLIQRPANIRIRILGEDDDTTDIESVKANDDEHNALYNTQGIRVGSNYKGIVIKNGKKYMVK